MGAIGKEALASNKDKERDEALSCREGDNLGFSCRLATVVESMVDRRYWWVWNLDDNWNLTGKVWWGGSVTLTTVGGGGAARITQSSRANCAACCGGRGNSETLTVIRVEA
uniref:Uncharacterized protein n=1 Tax=Oryza glumipatula TaxID=40148 RepID=A0A0D9YH83_9ORYZ